MDEKKLSRLNKKLKKFKDVFSESEHKSYAYQKEALPDPKDINEKHTNQKALSEKHNENNKAKPKDENSTDEKHEHVHVIDEKRLSKLNNKLNKFKEVFDEKDHKPATWQKECQNFKQHQAETSPVEKNMEQKNEELVGYMEELSKDGEHLKQVELTYNKLLLKHTQLQDEHIRLQGEHLRLQDEYITYLKSENTKLKNSLP